MRYVGGKFKIAKPISEIILSEINDENTFISLFCGSCAIESRICKQYNFNNIILNDIYPYLIAMYKDYQNGRIFPENISKEEYYYIKAHQDEDPALTGFVRFGCSFGGKWWGGYGRNIKRKRNLATETIHSLNRDLPFLLNANFTNEDYKNIIIPDNSIIYCDPPYENTTGYRSLKKFNHEEFWEYMRQISKNNKVFISEQNAPDDFIPIWSKEIKRHIDVNLDNRFKVTEKLFVYKNGKVNYDK